MYRRTMSKVVVFALLAAGAVSAAVLASRNYGPCPTGTLTELAPWREYDMTGCGMQFGGHMSNDEGHFAYRQLTGDFDIIAQVIYYSPDGGDEGGVGIMARTSSRRRCDSGWVGPGPCYAASPVANPRVAI